MAMGSPSQNSDNLFMSLYEGDLSLFVLSSESACSLAFPHDSRQHEAPVGSRAQRFPEQWVEISSYVICLTDSVMATEREPRHWSVYSSHPCIQQPTWERLLQVLNLKRARCHLAEVLAPLWATNVKLENLDFILEYTGMVLHFCPT